MGQGEPLPVTAETFVGNLYKRFIVFVLRPYIFARLLYSRRFSSAMRVHRLLEAEEETMQLTALQLLFLVPLGLALAFMLWVLWSLTEQLSHRNKSIDKQPMISIRVGDRYALGTLPQRTPGSVSGARPGYSSARESSRTQGAPTPDTGIKGKSSSTIQGARN